MTKFSDTVFTAPLKCTARAWLATALLSVLTAGVIPATQAQTSGSLPIYRCVSADGTSSRISRTPCSAGETGKAQHAVAGTAKQKPAAVKLAPSMSVQSQAQEEATRRRAHTTHRSGRRR